jgi:IPT/TIG domain-containing protein
MKLHSLFFRTSLFVSAALFTSGLLTSAVYAQQQGDSDSDAAASAKFPAAKRRAATEPSSARGASQDSKKASKPEKDSADTIRKREAWFYKQRASANGHIPAGARGRALQHMQRMMVAEGKLVQRPDGSFAEVAPKSRLSPLGAVTSPWTSIGPNPTTGGTFSPVTGRVTTIAVDPSDATGNTVLIGGAQGGIWRSTDAGATWTAVGDQNASLAMGSIAFAPSACAASPAACTVYAGTGEQASVGFDIYYGEGVLKSTDHGQTWTQTCTTASATCPFIGPYSDVTPFGFFTLGGTRISYVAVNPSNPQMVLVAAQTQIAHGSTEGVYCSADGGSTWNLVPTASGNMATFVGFASPTVAFAALGDPFGDSSGGNGIFQSTNANATSGTSCALTFTKLSTGLPAATAMGRIDMGISPLYATDNTVYASIADAASASSANLGVFVTTNGGTSWAQTAAPDICQAQCWYDNVVKVDPNGGAHAFLGGSAVTDSGGNPIWVLRTANTGAAWATIIPNTLGPGLPHVDNHAFAFVKIGTKVRMYLGNDGGIWRTDDAEAPTVVWNNLNDSLLTLTQFYPAISVHPSSQGIAFAGAQDNGSQIYDQAVTGTTWTDNQACGDGTGTTIDNVIPSTVFVACNGDNIGVSVTNGVANSYVAAGNGINFTDNSNFVPPLTTDPSTANTAYLGTTKVYQTVNTGTNWTALSGDLVSGANFDSLIALAVAPANPAVVYAGANTGQVFVATNVIAGAGTFNAVTGQASLPPRQVSAIAVDAADPTGKTAYAAFSGFAFGTDTKGHLFRTADGGATWQDVSCTVANCSSPGASDLPNTPVNDVVVDPDNPDTPGKTLYVGTDIGVFQGTCVNATPTVCTWATLSTGLPRVAVLSLKLHHASRTLMGATHGRGTWSILLNNFTFPGPHISSLSPVSAAAGSAQFALSVNGNGLTGGTVQWNGSALTTTVVNDTQLTATVPASMVSGAGAPPITVLAGATSNALTFTVLGGPPTISSPVAPTSAPVNSAATMITVNGTGFSATSKVLMNPDVGGTPIATTFISATQLTATVPATFMAGFGSTNSVGVQNPPPGGGTTVTTATVTLPTFAVVAPAPANNNFASAANITSTNFTDTKDSSGATTQANDPAPPCSQDPRIPFVTGTSNTIWYKVVPTGSGTANIDTIGSSYDSVLSVWSGTSQTALTLVACNDDINPGIVVQSQLTGVPLTAGTTYYIMVSSFGQADPNPLAFGGKSVLNFSFTGTLGGGTIATTTTVTASPTSLPAGGGSVTLTATVVGTGTGASPMGTVQFMNGSTALGTPQTCSAVSGATSPTCKATLTATLSFLAPPIVPKRIPALRVPWIVLIGFALLLLLFLCSRRVPARYRRAYVYAGLLLLAALVAGLATACSGGYGGGGGGVHYDTITAVYSGDATYAGSTSSAVTITVQ